MTITESLRAFLSDPAGQAFQGLLVLVVAEFVTGVAAAVRDGTFAFSVVAAVLRKHVLGRAFPILFLLFLGYVAKADVLTVMGAGSAAVYVVELVASIKGNLAPPKDDVQPANVTAERLNPVPTE